MEIVKRFLATFKNDTLIFTKVQNKTKLDKIWEKIKVVKNFKATFKLTIIFSKVQDETKFFKKLKNYPKDKKLMEIGGN